jgi:hypothetical protein
MLSSYGKLIAKSIVLFQLETHQSSHADFWHVDCAINRRLLLATGLS